MIKVNFNDTKLKDINTEFLPFVQWKAVTLSDLEGAPTEVLSKYVFEMSKSVMKSLISNKRVDLSNLSTEAWIELLDDCYNENYYLTDYVQLPYHVIVAITESTRLRNRYSTAMARTQHQMPVELLLKISNLNMLNEHFRTNSHPGLIDFMITDEGCEIVKEKLKNSSDTLIYITSEEGNKFGIKIKNCLISPELLRRAGACDNGYNYCKKILRELNVDSIRWDEAVITVRNNKKLQKRDSIKQYMYWIADNKRIQRD